MELRGACSSPLRFLSSPKLNKMTATHLSGLLRCQPRGRCWHSSPHSGCTGTWCAWRSHGSPGVALPCLEPARGQLVGVTMRRHHPDFLLWEHNGPAPLLLFTTGSTTEAVLKPHFLCAVPSQWLCSGSHRGLFLGDPDSSHGQPASKSPRQPGKPFLKLCCCLRPSLPSSPSFLLSFPGARPEMQSEGPPFSITGISPLNSSHA